MVFAQERWSAVAYDIRPLLLKNWQETALDHAQILLDPDYELYAKADCEKRLSIVTARMDGVLVGYFINFVVAHPHYKSTLFGMMDVYFLEQQYRNAATGLRLFLETEKALRSLGVKEVIANSKLKKDTSMLFERLGWRKTAVTWTKLLQGETNG